MLCQIFEVEHLQLLFYQQTPRGLFIDNWFMGRVKSAVVGLLALSFHDHGATTDLKNAETT
jgi:hypothetical protein